MNMTGRLIEIAESTMCKPIETAEGPLEGVFIGRRTTRRFAIQAAVAAISLQVSADPKAGKSAPRPEHLDVTPATAVQLLHDAALHYCVGYFSQITRDPLRKFCSRTEDAAQYAGDLLRDSDARRAFAVELARNRYELVAFFDAAVDACSDDKVKAAEIVLRAARLADRYFDSTKRTLAGVTVIAFESRGGPNDAIGGYTTDEWGYRHEVPWFVHPCRVHRIDRESELGRKPNWQEPERIRVDLSPFDEMSALSDEQWYLIQTFKVGEPPPPPSSTTQPEPPSEAPKGVAPKVVPPKELERSRIAGDAQFIPDDATKTVIARSGKDKIVGSFKLCIDEGGDVTSVSVLKSTGFPQYDSKIASKVKTEWKYKPYVVDGQAVAVCTTVTFIYSRK